MPRMFFPLLLVGTSTLAAAQTVAPKAAYDFSLPREERIKLAKSAAPPEISEHATLYVLDRSGYARVQEGTNGFSCFVDRQTRSIWSQPALTRKAVPARFRPGFTPRSNAPKVRPKKR